MGNYRPVSILSCISKIFEKISIWIQKGLFYKIGFVRNNRTNKGSIRWRKLCTGTIPRSIKAFDTVNHKILLDKLINYGIICTVHDWFESYLEKRKQYTVVNNAKSKINEINIGVPQGSVLGPILFLHYVNDIGNVSKEVWLNKKLCCLQMTLMHL